MPHQQPVYKLGKLAFLILIVAFAAVCSRAQLLHEPASSTDSTEKEIALATPTAGEITFTLNLKWDALWDQNASFEQVSEEDRDEYVEEALNEVASKMKRKYSNRDFKKFKVLQRENEKVLVSYPSLQATEKGQLKEVALQLLSTNVVNTINVSVDGEMIDIFDIKMSAEDAHANYEKKQSQYKLSNEDLRLKKERAKKRERQEQEFKEAINADKKDTQDLEQAKLEMLELHEKNYLEMSEKMNKISKLVEDMQAQYDTTKSQRQAYEAHHGITDGDKRMEEAVAEARKRRQGGTPVPPPSPPQASATISEEVTTTTSDIEATSTSGESVETTPTPEETPSSKESDKTEITPPTDETVEKGSTETAFEGTEDL